MDIPLWQRSKAPLFEAFWQGRLIPGARIESLPFIEVCPFSAQQLNVTQEELAHLHVNCLGGLRAKQSNGQTMGLSHLMHAIQALKDPFSWMLEIFI